MIPILTFDVETTGFDAKKDEVIEIGAALFDWETKKPVSLQSDIVQYDGKINAEITRVTGIEQWMVKKPYAIPLKTAMFRLSRLMQIAKYIMAHNAQFDLRFLKAASEKTGIVLPERVCIDTMRDLPIPNHIKTKALNYLLTDHNLFNPFKHRAVFDCLSTFQLAACYDLEDIIEAQESELITVEALVDYDNKDLAREQGFHWNKDARKWLLEIKKSRFEKMEFPFDTTIDFEIPF
jgi:DNA polymerase III alpha subunit (gram-positive type)